MRGARLAGLVLCAVLAPAVLPACAMTEDAPAESAAVRLSPASPEATVAVGKREGPAVAVEIIRIVNPARNAFTIVVLAPGGEGEVLARLAPFPADQPGRYAVRVPEGVRSIRLRLEAVNGRKLPELVEARVADLPGRQ